MKLKLSKRYHTLGKPIKKARPSTERYLIYKEFDEYQRENYSTLPVICLCGNNNSYLISTVDREGWEYKLVLCESCGLIRAKEYWDEKSVRDFYKKWYRKKYGGESDPSILYNKHKMRSKKVWNFVIDYSKKIKEYGETILNNVIKEIDGMRENIKVLQEKLLEKGVIKDNEEGQLLRAKIETSMDKKGELYLTRQYEIFDNPNWKSELAKSPEGTEIIKNAKQFLRDDYKARVARPGAITIP